MKRRLATIVTGAIPVLALTVLISADHIPLTNISLVVPYAAEGPGPSFNTLDEGVVEITGAEVDETSGNLNMTTVSVRSNMTLAQALARGLFTDDDLVPIELIVPPGRSEEEVQQSNELAFSTSEANATVAALNHLGRPLEVEVAGLIDASAAASADLAEGDVLEAVDGEEVTTPAQVREAVLAHQPGEEVTLRVRTGDAAPREVPVTLGENPDEPDTPLLGILMGSKSADGIEVTYNLQDIGGPSAGMMFSLAVVDKLSPGELTGGHFVAGTGTIDEDGSVGEIGGIAHKVRAVEEMGAELFLAPAGNCGEALSGKSKDSNLVITPVTSLDDAIEAMADFSAGRPVKGCEAAYPED